MEMWFIYTLGSALFSGFFTFGLKMAAEKNLKGNLLTAIAFFTTVSLALVSWIVTGYSTESLNTGLLIGILSGALLASLYVIQIHGLRYIDTTIFYPIFKTLGPLLVIIAGVTYIGEDLTRNELIALSLSLLIPLMLITKSENSRQKNLSKGVIALLVCSLVAAIIVLLAKLALDAGVNLFLFVVIQTSTGLITNFIIGAVQKEQIRLNQLQKTYITYGLSLGVLMFAFTVFSFKALQEGLLSIVYTVQSFYILIPIILSVFIYREHMNLRKGLAIMLSVLAIIFFQI